MTEPSQNGWSEYKKLFEKQMSTLAVVEEQVTQCRIEIAKLKQAARLWGFIAGLIPASIMAAVTLFTLFL